VLADHFVQQEDLGGEAGGKLDEVLAALDRGRFGNWTGSFKIEFESSRFLRLAVAKN
jgi:hypothetical protein